MLEQHSAKQLAFEVGCTADKLADTGHTVDTAVYKGCIQGTAGIVSIAAGTNAQLLRLGEQKLMHRQTLLLPLTKLPQLWL